MLKFFLLGIVGFLISGCAIGNTHRYDLGDAALVAESDKRVAVCVADQRPYVLSGEKPESFVGLMRGGFGNPFDINTTSGGLLASDITTSIVKALKAKRISAVPVDLPPKTGADKAREILLKAEADRFVLMVLNEWKTDTYFNTGLRHDITLKVLTKDGSQLVEKKLGGDENLGSVTLPADVRVKAETAIRQKLETLFNDRAVVSALK